MRTLGLIIAGVGGLLSVLSFVMFEIWQNNGAFYRGLESGLDIVAFVVSTVGFLAISIGLLMFYNNEHGERLGW